MNLRFIAALVLYDVIVRGFSLSDALSNQLNTIPNARDAAFVQAITFGVCRTFFKLDAIAKNLLAKPLKNKDQDIYILILIGLYQLIDMRVPDHAAISETVNAAKSFKKIWAKSLINGVLRTYQREKNHPNTPEVIYAHPSWFIEKIKKSWPEHWQAILEANNMHPPFTVRVNLQKISREDYLKKLNDEKLSADSVSENECGVVLETPTDVINLPGFKQGFASVQDAAAQLAADLLLLKPAAKVLDACAAPGGKTAHILEKEPEVILTAIDCNPERVLTIQENMTRLQLSPHQILCADASDAAWWDGQLFDRILLDAPCSATGVIRRHPDIKCLRRATDILPLTKKQEQLLEAAWNMLKPGGLLLYATCSIFPEENFLMLKSFLEKHPNAKEDVIQADWGVATEIGRQILPGMHNMDGFYYGRLRKC